MKTMKHVMVVCAVLALACAFADDDKMKPAIGFWVADEAATLAALKKDHPEFDEAQLQKKMDKETGYMMEIDAKAVTLHQGRKPFADTIQSVTVDGKTINVKAESMTWSFTPTEDGKMEMAYTGNTKFLRKAEDADKKAVEAKIAARFNKKK